jgi:carbon dioxide concentrating mechanism protein CcmO
MVGAADAMLKSSEVYLAAYETIGDGLCTVIIRGNVTDVALAIEAGMAEAERIGELNAVMVIPRPLDDMEDVLPTAECWLEQPLALPLSLKESETEMVEAATAEEAQEQMAQPLALPEMERPNLDMPKKQALPELEPAQFDISQPQPPQRELAEPGQEDTGSSDMQPETPSLSEPTGDSAAADTDSESDR